MTLYNPPELPANQWWKIEHNPKSQTKPLKVTLMEQLAIDGTPSKLARAIGMTYSVANQVKLWEDMDALKAAASAYADFVGEYGKR